MTLKQMFENALVAVNKVETPSLLLNDFNFFANKAVYQICNKNYNNYEINQQLTDNLRILKATSIIDVDPILNNLDAYKVTLPSDYYHILGCICVFTLNAATNCKEAGTTIKSSAIRLTSDMWPRVIENYYNQPTYKRPYFFLNHLNQSNLIPTDPHTSTQGTDISEATSATVVTGGLPDTIDISTFSTSLVDKIAKVRYGNASAVLMEIRCGNSTTYTLNKVIVDYLKVPQYLKLTQEEIDNIDDSSQILEWPDYMCYEILNELVALMLENASDPRLQTNIPINQSITSPIQGLAKK